MGCAEYLDVAVANTMIAAYRAALLQQEQERIAQKALLEQGKADVLAARLLITTIVNHWKEIQGKIGEKFAAENVVGALDLVGTPFTPAKHGLDNVFQDSQNRMVALEAKCCKGSPFSELHQTKHGKEFVDNEWFDRKAELMQKSSSAQYTPDNARLGKQIQQAIKDNNLRAVLVHINPETKTVTLYERVSEDKFDMVYQWEWSDSNE